MVVKFRKYFSKVFVFLSICVLGLNFGKAYASKDMAILIRDLYRARLEYRSDSCSSKRLYSLIKLLEDSGAPDWDKTPDWISEVKFRMILDVDYYNSVSAKLCSEVSYDAKRLKEALPVITDFGESLRGHHWRLVKGKEKIFLECV